MALKTPKTNADKRVMPRHWRIVKQRRKLGLPFWLEDGEYLYNGLSGQWSWRTYQEWDYPTREAAVEALKTFPATWGGDRSLILGDPPAQP